METQVGLSAKTNIEYVNSEQVKSCSQLFDTLHSGVGILIDGRIYTSLDSINETSYLSDYYDFTCNKVINADPSYNKVKTPEFERISKLARSICFLK